MNIQAALYCCRGARQLCHRSFEGEVSGAQLIRGGTFSSGGVPFSLDTCPCPGLLHQHAEQELMVWSGLCRD